MCDPSKTEPELIKKISALEMRIQELERSEEELRLSRQQLQLLINSGPDFFFLKDLYLRYQLVNSANAGFFGLDEAQILGKTDRELMPEGAAAACQESDRLAIQERRIVVTVEPVGDKVYETYKFPVMVADEIVGVAGIIRDITDRTRAEEALRESERRFRSLVETTSDWVWEVNSDGFYTYSSPKIKDLLGYEPEDVVGKTPFDLMPEDEAERVGALFNKIAESHLSFAGLENVNLHKDGREIVLETSGVPIFDANGNLLGYRGIDRDITERKQAEEALKQSESRLSGIIEFLPDATLAVDLEGKIISWNKAIEEMTGVSADTMLGKGNYEYGIPFYGERRPILVDFLFSWNDDIAKKYSFIKKDGDTLYTETDVPFVRGQKRTLWGKASVLRNAKGDVIGAIESIRDVTDRKQAEEALQESEEKFRLLFEKSADSILLMDGYTFIDCNEAALRLMGCSSKEQLIGLNPWDVSPVRQPDGRLSSEKGKELIAVTMKRGINQFEWMRRTFNGEEFWVEVSHTVIPTKGRQLVYTMWKDIRERKHAEAQPGSRRSATGWRLKAPTTGSPL